MSIPYKKLKNLPEAQNLQDSDITIIEDLDTTRKGTLRLTGECPGRQGNSVQGGGGTGCPGNPLHR